LPKYDVYVWSSFAKPMLYTNATIVFKTPLESLVIKLISRLVQFINIVRNVSNGDSLCRKLNKVAP
jgi:hypothetical protein